VLGGGFDCSSSCCCCYCCCGCGCGCGCGGGGGGGGGGDIGSRSGGGIGGTRGNRSRLDAEGLECLPKLQKQRTATLQHDDINSNNRPGNTNAGCNRLQQPSPTCFIQRS